MTQQYPEVKPELPLHYRGVHRLNRDEQGRVKCVACMLCATACPANCIAIEAAPAPPEWPDRDKFPATFVLDELRCIYCGMCEEACPVDAIELTHIYDLTADVARGDAVRQARSCSRSTTRRRTTRRTRCGRAAGDWGRRRSLAALPAVGPATAVEDKDRAAKTESPGVIGKAPPDRYGRVSRQFSVLSTEYSILSTETNTSIWTGSPKTGCWSSRSP